MRMPKYILLEGTMSQFKHIFFAVTALYRVAMLVLLCPVVAAAQEGPLSLEGAVDRALQEAPQGVASAATLEAAQVVAPSAGRLPDPELVTGVDNLPVNTADRFSFTRDFMTMRKIGVMQAFPNSEKRRLQGERAHREIAVAHGEALKTRFETSRAVAAAWIGRAEAPRLECGTQLCAARTGFLQPGVARISHRSAAVRQEQTEPRDCREARVGARAGSRAGCGSSHAHGGNPGSAGAMATRSRTS